MPARDGERVIVIGEALIDLIEDGEGQQAVPGGSAANVALGLARRGIEVRFATCLGRDVHGSQIAAFLAAEGVAVDSASFGGGRTSIARARRSPSGEVTYRFDVDWRLPKVDLGADATLVHVGSFPAFASSSEELLSLLRDARRSRLTSWDPNVRPDLAPDRVDAQRRFHALLAELDVVKLSEADADYLLPGTRAEAIPDVLLERGVRLAVVTLAERGLIVADATGRVRVSPAPVAVADTIGAGDTVMSSLIADVVDGRVLLAGDDDLEGIGHRAASAAAVTVSRRGADLPFASDLVL